MRVTRIFDFVTDSPTVEPISVSRWFTPGKGMNLLFNLACHGVSLRQGITGRCLDIDFKLPPVVASHQAGADKTRNKRSRNKHAQREAYNRPAMTHRPLQHSGIGTINEPVEA